MEAAKQRAPVILGPSKPEVVRPAADILAKGVSHVVMAAGMVFLLGSALDVGVLWLLQRQPAIAWEFVALQNTLESFPRVVLGCGLVGAALYLRRARSYLGIRLLSGLLVLLALAAAAMGLLVFLDYAVVAHMSAAQPAVARAMLKVTAARALGLSGLYTVLLGTFGVLGFRRPRS